MMVSGNSVLYVRHLPSELSASEREELLKLAGAISVKIMPDDGKMKFSAFATFESNEKAKKAISVLHQRDVLGKRLVVEYASNKHQNFVPHLSDQPKLSPQTAKETLTSSSEREILKRDMEDFSRKLHSVSPALGLEYIPSSVLKYKYPFPTPTIIQNISHALASVPKFYTQVLHLMNKMNLPAPFGPLTPAPPLAPDVCLKEDKSTEINPSDLGLEIMEISSEESEYESEPEEGEKKNVEQILPLKRPLQKIKRKRKMPKMSVLALNVAPPLTNVQKPRTEPSEVFESLTITQKKITLKKIDQITPIEPTTVDIEPAGGFGAFEAPKEIKVDDDNQEPSDENWESSKFITSEELRQKRKSSREMKTMSIFRNYSAGDPTCRLYIKNLARQVVEQDLRYIFGRYIDRNSELDRNMFDIKLMKEGRMKGQAFITLANEEQAVHAVKDTNGFVLHTKPMVVQFARSAKPKEDDKKGKK